MRYTPEGIEDVVVELPVPNITSVAFGGWGMSTLFVGSARENLTEAQLEAHPLSGAIFAIDTRTHGRPARPPRTAVRRMTGFSLQRDGDGPANRVDG